MGILSNIGKIFGGKSKSEKGDGKQGGRSVQATSATPTGGQVQGGGQYKKPRRKKSRRPDGQGDQQTRRGQEQPQGARDHGRSAQQGGPSADGAPKDSRSESGRPPRPRRRKPRPRNPEQLAAAEQGQKKSESPAAERSGSGRKIGGRSRDKRDGRPRRGRKPSSEQGGSDQRVVFPDLLEVTESSPEFVENEFAPLGLKKRVVLALAANRFRTPTDIQRETIPVALRGNDILGQAKTGTGKTIAFLMPIFDMIDHSEPAKIQALIVVPTRELSRQVAWEARRFGRTLNAEVLNFYGGTSVKREIDQIEKGAHIVIGTPGRLLDHIFNHNLDLSHLKILVLDEADRMLDIGFRQDIIKIIKACPESRQVMLLSATLEGEVNEIGRKYMKDPVEVYVSRDEVNVDSIWQRYLTVPRPRKMEALYALLADQKPTQSIIFTNTKRMSDTIALNLRKRELKAQAIHSDLSQNKRERIMDSFRTGGIEHLVATDVAARGLDITGISHVINYDIPDNAEDYVHRVGRTGRMGAAGKAFTFVSPNEGKNLTAVEKKLNLMLEEYEIDTNRPTQE